MAEIRRNPPAEPSAEPAVQPALAPDAVAISVSSGLLQTQHFLDGVDDLSTTLKYLKERVDDKYRLENIPNLTTGDGIGHSQQHQPSDQLPHDQPLKEFVKHVFTSLKKKQVDLYARTLGLDIVITDQQAVNKLLNQVVGEGVIEGPRAHICVLGRYNVGKSTLLSALLCSDILPTSQDAETAVSVYIQHCEIQNPELCRMSDGAVLEKGAKNIKKYLAEVQKNVRSHASEATVEYLVKIPIPCFARLHKGHTITPLLVDTPGSNEVTQEKLQEIAHLNLQTAAAYIYVMSFSDLRNIDDYNSFKSILKRDTDVFNESRMAVVVTKMDESHKAVRPNERLTKEEVKEIVSSETVKALQLQTVPPGIIFPVSGDLAFQACAGGDTSEMVDSMRTSWGNIKRESLGFKAFQMAGSMSAQELQEELKELSCVSDLEKRIELMIDNLDLIWRKSIVSNCWLYTNQAQKSLTAAVTTINQQMQVAKSLVDSCKDIVRLHRHITDSMLEKSDLLTQLDSSYAVDTHSNKLMKRFQVVLDQFMRTVRPKVQKGNYTPSMLNQDLEDFHIIAEEKVTNICWQTTFDQCQQRMTSYLVIMTEKFGRLRSTLAKVCNQASGMESLPPQYVANTPDSIDDVMHDTAPRLNQIQAWNISVSKTSWAGYFFCRLLLGLPHIHLISKEDLDQVESDIKQKVIQQHKSFFESKQESIKLHFFKRYCKEMIKLMDVLFDQYQTSPVRLSDIATNALVELRNKEKLRDSCLDWETEVKTWKAKMRVSFKDLLPVNCM